MVGTIRAGIGGWDYDPWRGSFFPPELPKARQLAFASRALTAIEVNATYYRLQRRELYEKWAEETPAGFRFALKGSRYCTNRRVLAEGAEAVARYLGQGLDALGERLGPILWQVAATKAFDPDDFAAFLRLLPGELAGLPLRHAVEARHLSFADGRAAGLARRHGVALAHVDDEGPPPDHEPTASFAYLRLKKAREEEGEGYRGDELDRWADRARGWAAAGTDVYLFAINGAKVKAPAVAAGLIRRLDGA